MTVYRAHAGRHFRHADSARRVTNRHSRPPCSARNKSTLYVIRIQLQLATNRHSCYYLSFVCLGCSAARAFPHKDLHCSQTELASEEVLAFAYYTSPRIDVSKYYRRCANQNPMHFRGFIIYLGFFMIFERFVLGAGGRNSRLVVFVMKIIGNCFRHWQRFLVHI